MLPAFMQMLCLAGSIGKEISRSGENLLKGYVTKEIHDAYCEKLMDSYKSFSEKSIEIEKEFYDRLLDVVKK